MLRRKKKVLKLDVTNLEIKLPKKSPKVLQIWNKDNLPSKEYIEMLDELMTLVRYIGKRLNEGPEVKESLMKRTVTLKSILMEITHVTILDGYHRYGILVELLNDVYMETSGNIKTVELLNALRRKTRKTAQQKDRGMIA